MGAIQNPLFSSVALVIPHPALSRHLCLWLSAESAALVFPCKQLKLPVDLLSQGFLGNQPWQLLELCPFPGPRRALLPFAGPAVAQGGQYFRPCFCTLGHSCWHFRLCSPKQRQQSIRAARWHQPLPALTTQSHKWRNFCGKQPRLFYYLFLFFYNTPEHNLKLPLESTRPTVPFFLLGNTVYSDHPILLPLPGGLAEWMLMK